MEWSHSFAFEYSSCLLSLCIEYCEHNYKTKSKFCKLTLGYYITVLTVFPYQLYHESAMSLFNITTLLRDCVLSTNYLPSIFITGLLTVDPKKRLTLEDVKHSHWLFPESVPQTPLMTPDVLNGSRSMLGFQIQMTMNAFNKAAKSGFKLNSVLNAPLAQRRKNKKCSATSHSDSCDSWFVVL